MPVGRYEHVCMSCLLVGMNMCVAEGNIINDALNCMFVVVWLLPIVKRNCMFVVVWLLSILKRNCMFVVVWLSIVKRNCMFVVVWLLSIVKRNCMIVVVWLLSGCYLW